MDREASTLDHARREVVGRMGRYATVRSHSTGACQTARGMRLLLVLWAYVVGWVVAATFAVLVLLYWASGRSHAGGSSWHAISLALRLAVLFGPTTLGVILAISS